jgi:hypothetical protein
MTKHRPHVFSGVLDVAVTNRFEEYRFNFTTSPKF